MKKKFKKFLKEHNAWKKYKKEFSVYGWPIKVFLAAVSPSEYLISAFVWPETKQGHKFWKKLNKKWIKLCKN